MPQPKAAPSFDFMGRRRPALIVSAILIIGSILVVAMRGLNFGIDFTGGVMLEFSYAGEANLEDIRTSLTEFGFEEVEVQSFGSEQEVLVRIPPIDEGVETEDIGAQIQQRLRASDASATLQQAERIDSEVGDDLTDQGGLAMLFALILIFLYVMLRFRWKFAAGAIAALVHDVIITIGFFAVTQLTFDLSTLAAILAVIGYSLNDTIVVYDRIRENFRLLRRGSPIDVANTSVNQTLSRTLITGLTTLLVLVALLLLGGESVATFSIALIVGVVVGTYSSIYVASAAALLLDVSQQDLIPVKVEEVDSMP
ncbi:MAG: protein translocase subunit SecF [Gammaproteobacteria bacterium]|jgi:preprotein translocase subunit SecF